MENSELNVFILTGVVFFGALASFIIYFVIAYRRSRLGYLAREELLRTQYREQLLLNQVEIQEETFKTIGQEIHDNIGQSLSFVKVSLAAIDLAQTADAKAKLTASKEMLTRSIQDLRDIARSLDTDFIKQTGLAEALQHLLGQLGKTGIYRTSFSLLGNPSRYELQRELVVFRMVQEALNNAVRHAEANTITVEMDYAPEQLQLRICDNGKGFNTSLPAKGLGLANMRHRIGLVDGSLKLHSTTGKGTTITIQLTR